nr:hypothetical protein [candidate division Zixibacteria bacterium]
MKLTKALAIIFAMVLVVICFNAPVVFGEDEYPWDEDNDNSSGGIHGTVEDSLKYGDTFNRLTAATGGANGGNTEPYIFIQFVPILDIIIWYDNIPGVHADTKDVVKAGESEGVVTRTNAK